jgi:phage FluMu protein Com
MVDWEIKTLNNGTKCEKCNKLISESDTVYFKPYVGIKCYPNCNTEQKFERNKIDYDELRKKFYFKLKQDKSKFRFFYPKPDYDDS